MRAVFTVTFLNTFSSCFAVTLDTITASCRYSSLHILLYVFLLYKSVGYLLDWDSSLGVDYKVSNMSSKKTTDGSSDKIESLSEEQELAALREQDEDAEVTDTNPKEMIDESDDIVDSDDVPWDTPDMDKELRFEITEESTWTVNKDEGDDLYARSTVIDTETGIEFEGVERNAFDVGYQVYLWDTVEDQDVDEWVNVTGYVVSVENPDIDSIAQKFRLKLNMDAFLFKNSDEHEAEYIDVTVWESTNVDTTVEKGDEIILTSVIVDEFNGDKYLSCNSASELSVVSQDYGEEVSEKVRVCLKHHGSLDTTVRT